MTGSENVYQQVNSNDPSSKGLGTSGPQKRRRVVTSLFKKLDEFGALRNPAKYPKHPKRGLKSVGREQRTKEIDSNKDAPPWTIEEDFHLLYSVRVFLNPTGNINWSLVADSVNSRTSLTGRHRTKNQCRDRYFRTIMPREEGKPEAAHERSEKKKKKDGKGAVTEAPPVKRTKTVSTQRLYEIDHQQSIMAFHSNAFGSVQKNVANLRRVNKSKRWEPHASHTEVASRIKFGAAGPFTPVHLSEMRLKRQREQREKDQKEQEAKHARLRAQQAANAVAAAAKPAAAAAAASTPRRASASTPGKSVTPTNPAAVRQQPQQPQPQQQQQPQQVTQSHRLTIHILQNSPSEEPKLVARRIYHDHSLSEAKKVEQLTNIIRGMNSGVSGAAAPASAAASTASRSSPASSQQPPTS